MQQRMLPSCFSSSRESLRERAAEEPEASKTSPVRVQQKPDISREGERKRAGAGQPNSDTRCATESYATPCHDGLCQINTEPPPRMTYLDKVHIDKVSNEPSRLFGPPETHQQLFRGCCCSHVPRTKRSNMPTSETHPFYWATRVKRIPEPYTPRANTGVGLFVYEIYTSIVRVFVIVTCTPKPYSNH